MENMTVNIGDAEYLVVLSAGVIHKMDYLGIDAEKIVNCVLKNASTLEHSARGEEFILISEAFSVLGVMKNRFIFVESLFPKSKVF